MRGLCNSSIFAQVDPLLLLLVCSMYAKLAIEIRLFDIKSLILGPFVKAQLLYQAKVEQLCVVGSGRRLVCVRRSFRDVVD